MLGNLRLYFSAVVGEKDFLPRHELGPGHRAESRSDEIALRVLVAGAWWPAAGHRIEAHRVPRPGALMLLLLPWAFPRRPDRVDDAAVVLAVQGTSRADPGANDAALGQSLARRHDRAEGQAVLLVLLVLLVAAPPPHGPLPNATGAFRAASG